ncbi:RDD family protein [Deltaproteobacteria bacterium TL4]
MEKSKPTQRLRIASKGKRLFGLIFDFVFCLLCVNSFKELTKKEHWDLERTTESWEGLLIFYGSLVLLLIVKDIFNGCSLGKYLTGIIIRPLNNIKEPPSVKTVILRNLTLLIIPVEGLLLLVDKYARRLGDRWLGTVVIENPKALRLMLRLLLANMVFFVFFFGAMFFQSHLIQRTAAYQTAIHAINNHEPLLRLLGHIDEIEAPEMHLDLSNRNTPSLLQVKLTHKEQALTVQVFLQLQQYPERHWQVKEIHYENPESTPEAEALIQTPATPVSQ